MSGNLGPSGFVILWVIQLGTWRDTLWEKVSGSASRAFGLGSVLGRGQQKDPLGEGSRAGRGRVVRGGAGCARVRIPG